MTSSAPRFVLHTVADHLNYTAAIGKEDAARLQDILHRRHCSQQQKQLQKASCNVDHCTQVDIAETELTRKDAQKKFALSYDTTNNYKHPNVDGNLYSNKKYKDNFYRYNQSNMSSPTEQANSRKMRQMPCTRRTNATSQSRRAHLNNMALPKVNCQCQKFLPRVPLQYRRDGVFDATYSPGVDYDRIIMPRVRVMSALSATYTHPQSLLHHSNPSSFCNVECDNCDKDKLIKDKVKHCDRKESTYHTLQSQHEMHRRDANTMLLASTVNEKVMTGNQQQEQVQMCRQTSTQNNDIGAHKAFTKHTRTPSVFSHSSSCGPITKLGVPHLTSHATAQGVQVHLAHLHAQRSHSPSTLTAQKLLKNNETCMSNAKYSSPHAQGVTPFHEMSTYELSRWLQQVQLHPTY